MMFRKSLFLFTLVIILTSVTAQAQFHLHVSSSSPQRGLGNDFWFAIPQNYEDQSGKYFYLYTSSPFGTVVHVETEMGSMQQTIAPNKVAAFNIPLSWEMKNSDSLSHKAIHVWADEGLNVYLMSHNPYTSDMTQILPIQNCGTDYIVAAYSGLNAGGADYPSEFVIASSFDSNRISITPSCDLRSTSANVEHASRKPFFLTLNRGQSIQFKASSEDSLLDVTGTRVQSRMPVAILGASQCPDIPAGYPYCDHVLEMIAPIQNWGTVYYTAPSFARLSGDTYLIVSSVAGQRIMRLGASSGIRQEAIIDQQYGTYWVNDIDEGSKWYSDKPFFLVQYLNSSTWDCSSCGFGDPAEMVVYPVSKGTKYFQTPTSQGSQSPYVNYINLTVNRAAESSTRFDGTPVAAYTKISIDSNYEIFRPANVRPGAHRLESDSATSVVIYGYGSYESFGASVASPAPATALGDSVPPQVTIDSGKLCTKVKVTETGSGLLSIKDTGVINMTVSFDSNIVNQSVLYRDSVMLCVIDTLKPASGVLFFTDKAGNQTAATISRNPSTLYRDTGFVALEYGAFPITKVGDQKTQVIVKITDTSTTTLTIDSAWSTEPAFTYASLSRLGNHIPFTIRSKDSARIAFVFAPPAPGLYSGIAYIRTKEASTFSITLEGRAVPPAAVRDPDASINNSAFADWLQKGSGSFLLLPASPNPTTGILNVTYGLREPSNVSIAIFDLLGNRVYNFAFESQSGLSQQSLDLRMLGSATYFYRVEASGQVQTGRFSIER